MTNIVLPYNPTGSTTKSIEGVNNNFAAVAAVVNGELDHTNLAAGAGVLPSQLDLSAQGETFTTATAFNAARQLSTTRPGLVIGTMFLDNGSANIYWDSANPPTSGRFLTVETDSSASAGGFPFTLWIPAGWYWEATKSAAGASMTAYEVIL